MNFLFDTNVLIALEPTSPDHVEAGTERSARLVARLNETGHRILLHSVGLGELQRDPDDARRRTRVVLIRKYGVLPAPPSVPASMRATLGPPTDSHSAVDDEILAAIVGSAAHHLVTEDRGLHRKARTLGVGERVLTVNEALELLDRLHPGPPEPPPAVESCLAHELDFHDPIFDSFRDDYGQADFNDWFARAQREHRPAWIIHRHGEVAAVSLVKDERSGSDLRFSEPTLKVSSFKVSDRHSGHRFGELLLRAVFEYAAAQSYEHLYLSVFDRHEALIALLMEFGFSIVSERRSAHGELYMHKPLSPAVDPDSNAADLSALEHHRRYGPPALPPNPPATYLVPIQERYRQMLFPDAGTQRQLALDRQRPYANAIRKAYLCHAPIRRLDVGAIVAFYESAPTQAVGVIGVVEATLRSSDPGQIVGFVSNRTVYPLDEVETMCRHAEVLAIVFRLDRVLTRPVPLEALGELCFSGRLLGTVVLVCDSRGDGCERRAGDVGTGGSARGAGRSGR